MEKQSVAPFKQYRERGFSKVNIFKNGGSNVFLLNLLPNQHMPEHYHPGSQLFFHVIEGNGRFIVNNQPVEVKKDDILHVLGTEKVGFMNTGDDSVTIYVTLCKLDDEDRIETC